MGVVPVNQTQIYAAKAVFITSGAFDTDQTVSGSLRQLARVHDLNWDVAYPVDQVTYLDAGDEAYMTSHNPVDVTISWYHTNGRNEQAVGLVDTVGPSGRLALNLDQEKNIYITIEGQPVDAVQSTLPPASRSVIGMGQAVMTSYSLSAQDGGLLESRAKMNCLTAVVYTGASGNAVPAVNYVDGSQLTGRFTLYPATTQYNTGATGYADPIAAAAIPARDMYLTFPQGTPFSVVFSGAQACYLQGFDLNLTVNRREIKPLGYVYPRARATFYPIEVNLTTNAIINAYQADELDRISCLNTGQAVNLIVKQPCSSDVLFAFFFDRLQITNQGFATTVGTPDTATIQWKGLITSPNSIVCSPWVGTLVDLNTNSGWGGTW